MRFIRTALAFSLVIAFGLLLAVPAKAEEVSFLSASPYQLAELLGAAPPEFELRIGGNLVYPVEKSDAMPAFVFMHGSGGPLLRHHAYLELARELGFATLQLDSFGPRGIGSTVGNQTDVTAAMMATDLLMALKFLNGRPEVDRDRIVVMGSSKGAIAALYAAWSPVREKLVGELDYAGYALLYPLCGTIEDGRVTASPVHIFIGREDNWTPPVPCIAQVERMKARGRDWAITLYDGAYHGFDAPIEGVREVPHAYSMVGCNFALRADGYEYETGSGYLLTRAERGLAFRACARKGAVKMGGYHAVDALKRDLAAFLERVRQ